MEDNDYKDILTLKILLLGGCNAGKTNIFYRYTENKFIKWHLSTIGIDFRKKIIKFGKYDIKLMIWDTAGQDRFRNINRSFYKHVDGFIFVCDITDYDSFNDMISYIEEINDFFYNRPKIICANKCDLEKERQIKKEEIIKYGLSKNIEVFETSAKIGQNINESFHRLVELIMSKREKDLKIIENINNEKYLYDYRLDLINSFNITFSHFKMFNIFCDEILKSIGWKILKFNNNRIRLIININHENNDEEIKFLNKMKSKEDGIIFFIDINSNSSFEEIKNLISENIQNNSEKIIVIKKNNSENENKELSKEIENYSLSKKIKIFIIDDIYKEIVNNIFFELISLILKKKGIIQNYKEFNKYISENKKYNYALIGDKYSGKTKIFKEYFNLNESNIGIKALNINGYEIKLEVYDIDELNLIKLLNKYKINGIIFIFSPNAFESFEKMKEYINIIKQKYKNDYESIVCENKSNINEILTKDKNNYFLELKQDIYELNINSKDSFNKIILQLTYQILLKEKNENLISEFYERNISPIHNFEKKLNKLNKYLNF